MAENSDDIFDALDDWLTGHLADKVNTSLEGVIVAYKGGRVDVRPTGNKTYSDGDSNAYGVIYDLPLHWLAGDGGKAGVKIPVKVGDKCTIVFKQHPQSDEGEDVPRRFSLADAYVLPGVAYPDDLPGNDNVKLYYGSAFFEITPDGVVNVNAPGGFNVTAPKSTFSQEVIAKGLFTYQAGMTGSGSAGGVTATINGRVVVMGGDVEVDGIGVKSHHHTAQGANADTTSSKA
jgi:hypothetical protein